MKEIDKLFDCNVFQCNESRLKINGLQRAIIVVFAPWSGAAITRLEKLASTVNDQKRKHELLIVLANNDTLDSEQLKELFGHVSPCHGYAEMLWVKKGHVIDKHFGTGVISDEELVRKIHNVLV